MVTGTLAKNSGNNKTDADHLHFDQQASRDSIGIAPTVAQKGIWGEPGGKIATPRYCHSTTS